MSDPTLSLLTRGCVDVIDVDDLKKRLASGKRLRIKVGFDPTAPDLHLGHAVILHKMRQFQDLGHEVIFLIGDFTGLIGDPTGKSVTRKPLTHQQVQQNARTYADQVFKILDPEKTNVQFNSTWMNAFNATEFIHLAAQTTIARMLERDDFSKRYASNQPVALHELLYPLVQAYDSVELKADIEMGGTDQTFNLLMGRTIQSAYGQPPQIVMTLPLLEGLDGVQKMSKSLGNTIALHDTPADMFGKLMSVSDTLMWRYFELLSFQSTRDIDALKTAVEQGENPRNVKIRLAQELVTRYHGEVAAREAHEAFTAQFSRREIPEDIPTFEYTNQADKRLGTLLVAAGVVTSQSEARRLIAQNGLRLNGETVNDVNHTLPASGEHLVQAGKRRWLKLVAAR